MKIYMDNENSFYHRVVTVQNKSANSMIDYLNTVIDALKGLGVSKTAIADSLLLKCEEWGLIESDMDDIDEENIL